MYKGGSELLTSDVLSVKNNAGAELYDEAFNFYGSTLTFENVADASETSIELPNTTGTFNVTFSVGMIDADTRLDFVDLQDDWYY